MARKSLVWLLTALSLVFLLALPSLLVAADELSDALDDLARRRAQQLFSTDWEGGELAVEAAYVLWHVADGGVGGTLQVLVEAPFVGLDAAGAGTLRLSILAQSGDGPARVDHRTVAAAELADADAWLYETPLAVDDEARELVVIVEETRTGRWGAAVAEMVDEPFELPEEGIARTRPVGTWSLRAPAGGTSPGVARVAGGGAVGGAVGGAGATPERSAVRILPPEGRRLAGPTLIETLISDLRVTKVEFFLDGEPVAAVEEPPFDATVSLAGAGREQTVRAVAYSGDRRMGEDSIRLNRAPRRPFRVRIAALTGDPAAGSMEVRAEVSLPAEARMAKMEYWFNDTLAETVRQEPFVARVATPGAGPDDFIRVVAHLEDGRSIEDVALLSARGVSEEVDVTLVELFVFATDRDGRPVRDLTERDFTVRVGGRGQKLERVAYASEVPLVLGLVVDTSGSMELMMEETKQAASGFLQDTVTPIDQAFLVDFDTLPRLRQSTTPDLMQLYSAFRGMVANGYTAMYDAILFALAEFDDGPQQEIGRRALVLVTDGDDYKSRFAVNRCVRAARSMGVPVYIIGLGTPNQLRGFTRLGLEAVTEKTGGRLYFVEEASALAGVYAEINAELRSQYLVTFYAEDATAAAAEDKVEVEIGRRGVKARTVVSPSG